MVATRSARIRPKSTLHSATDSLSENEIIPASERYFKKEDGLLKMDFLKVKKSILKKYQRKFNIPVVGTENEVVLAKQVDQHFHSQKVNEPDVIAQFLYFVHNMGNNSMQRVVLSRFVNDFIHYRSSF